MDRRQPITKDGAGVSVNLVEAVTMLAPETEQSIKITAAPVPRLQFRAPSRLMARLSDFATLMKPRVMLLAVFTAAVGLMIAPTHLDPLLAATAIVAIAMGAGAAGALNMWYDADIDRIMTRTAVRPIPRGRVSRPQALLFGVILAGSSVSVLGFVVNVTAAALLATAIIVYVVIYTVWLKRRTPQNIVIGGVAGALPPVIGWTAATGNLGVEPLVLFLIIFFWTPPHFWALSLNRTEEYARASVPMLPVVSGRTVTARQILIYTVLLIPVSMLPTILGFAGLMYGGTAVICGAVLLVLALQVSNRGNVDRKAARRLFAFSVVYLFLLFAALLTSSSNRESGSGELHRIPEAEHGQVTAHCLTDSRISKLYGIVCLYVDMKNPLSPGQV